MKSLALSVFLLFTHSAFAQNDSYAPSLGIHVGKYRLLEEAEGHCEDNIDLTMTSKSRRGRSNVSQLNIGSDAHFVLDYRTSTILSDKKCTNYQVTSFNDVQGWAESRKYRICKNESGNLVRSRDGEYYEKVTFDYDYQTLKLIQKKKGKTVRLCTWSKE